MKSSHGGVQDMIVIESDKNETAQFFVGALNQLTPPRFRSAVTDDDVAHKGMILADYAWIPRTQIDEAAAAMLIARQIELSVPNSAVPPQFTASIIGSACLMVTGFFDNGFRTLGYRSKEALIHRGTDAFKFAAEYELDLEKRKVYLHSALEFDRWRRYFLRLHRAFRMRLIAPPEAILKPPNVTFFKPS